MRGSRRMDRKAEEETNGSAIRDEGRGPRDNRAAIFVGWRQRSEPPPGPCRRVNTPRLQDTGCRSTTPLNLQGGDSHVTMWSVSSHTARFFYGYRFPVPVDCG